MASKVRATSFITLPASLAWEVNSKPSERYTHLRAAGFSSAIWISMDLVGTTTFSGQVRFSAGRRSMEEALTAGVVPWAAAGAGAGVAAAWLLA